MSSVTQVSLVRIRLGTFGISLLAVFAGACGAADPWRGCTLCLEQGRLPGLQRQADPGPPAMASTPHCAPVQTSGLPDEPETVDDLDALLGTGKACGPDGKAHPVPACASLSEHGWKASPPVKTAAAPPCGAAACPNQQVTLEREDTGTQLELEFYDDPSSHRPAASATCPTDQFRLPACYYRLGGVRTLVRL